MVFVLESEGALSSALLVHVLKLTGTACPYRLSQQLKSQWSVDNGESSDRKLLKIVLVIDETSGNKPAIHVHVVRKERTRCDHRTEASVGCSAGLEAVG
jgi:hypothetical protein